MMFGRRLRLRGRGKRAFFGRQGLMCRAAETGKMTARLGRASYVGGESLPPDPGAVGIAALVEGIATALQD
jgi:hypothetical protein